jgi:hypothetical protein
LKSLGLDPHEEIVEPTDEQKCFRHRDLNLSVSRPARYGELLNP